MELDKGKHLSKSWLYDKYPRRQHPCGRKWIKHKMTHLWPGRFGLVTQTTCLSHTLIPCQDDVSTQSAFAPVQEKPDSGNKGHEDETVSQLISFHLAQTGEEAEEADVKLSADEWACNLNYCNDFTFLPDLSHP